MTTHTILLNTQPVEYVFRQNRRAKHISLSIHPGGLLKVSAPRYVSHRTVETFIAQKSAWILEKIEHFKSVVSHGGNTPKDFLSNKARALKVVEEKVAKFNAVYQFPYKKISIRNQKSRWGSCSSKGNLNFNHKIALLPEHLAEYIVVHELCHLGQMNHSRKFWDLVAVTMPNYLQLRRELRGR